MRTTGMRLVSMLPVVLAACASDLGSEAEPPTGEVHDTEYDIINGAQPARGTLANLGVVRVNNSTGGLCSGTLVTNRHVLTARHCIRDWVGGVNGYGTLRTPANVTLEGATAAQDQTVASSNVFEPSTTTLDVGDYALIELSAPVTLNNGANTYFRGLDGSTDSQLVGTNVTCVGYGNNTEATLTPTPVFGSGAGTLRTANMTISAVSGGVVTRNRTTANQVGAPGDSGSTCFNIVSPGVLGTMFGPQSTCSANWVDVDGNGVLTNNGEWSRILSCNSASPNTIRTFVRQNTQVDVGIAYSFLPAQSFASSIATVVNATNAVTVFDARNPTTFSAARSGRIEVTVQVEPQRYMCPKLSTTVPVTGPMSLSGRCLSDGLLPVILG